MLLFQPNPLDLLLEKTERVAATRPPFIVFRQADACPFQDIEDAGLVDSGFLERQPDDELDCLGVFVNRVLRAPGCYMLVAARE